MLRKEIQGVLKQSLFFLAVVAGVSLVIKIALSKHVGSYFEVFYLMYQFSLLGFGAFMGLSVFLSDKRQRAEEYVFTLPYSRLQLLGLKVLPRLTAVVIIYLIFLGFYLGGVEGLLLMETFFTFSWLYWLVFVMTLSFSASADGYMKVGGIALLEIIVFLQLICFSRQLAFLLKSGRFYTPAGWDMFTLLTFDFSNILVPFLVVYICLLLPYIISFVLTFKKWGTYSKENYNKSYFKLFLPLIAVGFIISTLFVTTLIRERFHAYYLTSKHQLIETHGFSTRMVEADGDVSLKYSRGDFRAVFEDDEYVYGMHISSEPAPVVRIYKNTHTVDTLLEVTRPPRHRSCRFGIRVFKHMLVVPEYYKEPTLRKFVFIDTRSMAVKKIKTLDVLPSHYFKPHIFGADADPANGKIFWLIASERSHQFPIIKLWEDGKAENLGIMSGTFPVYSSRMLVTTTDDALVVRRITGDGLEMIREITRYKQLTFPITSTYARVNLNPPALKEIYFVRLTKRWVRNYLRLNLETFEISHIGKIFRKAGEALVIYPGEIYKIRFERDEKEIDARKQRHYLNKIYRLEGEKFILLKEFPAYEKEREGDNFWVSKSGVVIKYNNKLSVYTLPNMEPLEFKKKHKK
ncbi:MAG: ABC transporter permease [Candidatus Aminicenantes bacterium]|nr:MAG: ABC transporter permease [Candidatus Aminicenantes bacterium]